MNKPVERPHTSFEDDGHAIGGGPDNKLDIFDRSELPKRYEERKALEAITEQEWRDQDGEDEDELDKELDELNESLFASDAMPTRRIMMVRHGATALNDDDASVDRIRGWVDVPLSAGGRKEAYKLAKKLRANPPDLIVASDLSRAADTARIISEGISRPIVEISRAFRPWNVGHFTGELSEVAIPALKEYLQNDPEKEIPGGESFCEFRDRFFAGLRSVLDRYPEGVIAIVAHHRNERLMFAWAEAGFPDDGNVDVDTFTEKGEKTGSCQEITLPMPRVEALAI